MKHDTSAELKEIEPAAKTRRARKLKATRPPEKAIKLESEITPQQEAYCRGLALGMSRIEAAQMAGLGSKETARQWDRLPQVRKRVSELSELVSENAIVKNGLDRSWVISRLMDVAERCMVAEPVKDREGNMTGEYKFDSSGANRALELLGKTMRMFEAGQKEKSDEYANLSDDEIARIAAELAAQTGLAGYIAGTETPSGPQQVIEIQALPQTAGISPRGGEISGEIVPSGQPVGQDVVFGVRSGLSFDGDVSDVVDGQTLEPGGDGLGAGRIDGIDPGHDATVDLGPPGGVGDGNDPHGQSDWRAQASARNS